ncbi:FecCD family ABC transporter permease [Candidatus Latescibacterota bacterium]
MKKTTIILILSLIALLVLIFAPMIGIQTITPRDIFTSFAENPDDMASYIFWKIRIPRVLTSFAAGIALSLCGMVFQAMFRNPLATPFTLGVSSGAAFGAALYMIMGLPAAIFGISGISIFSFLGAMLSISIVYGVTMLKRGFSTSTMLLAGVAISFFFSSLILFFQYMSDFTQSFQIIRWLMGGFEIAGYSALLNMVPFILIGTVIVLWHLNELNLIATGDDIAASRGVNVRATKTLLFFATSLMVSGVVSICGPIGFVGMMAPHICRLLIGTNHKYLAPATMIFGGMFLALCDALSRTIIAPAEIPVGVITALLGGPFFLWLLLGGGEGRGIRR